MTNSLRMFKNALVLTIAAATVLATAGLTAFVPMQASAASFGDLIMGETLATVYYYGSDGQRYSFPNEKTFFSWYDSFDDVVSVTDEELADITLAGNIAYRAGSRWIKIESDEKTYAVSTDGSVHWIEDEDTAVGLAGDDWNQFIDDVPDVFFVDYTVGDSLTDASMGYDGMLWSDGTSNYLVWDGELRMLTDDGFEANNYQDGFVLMGEGFDMDSVTSGDDIDSELALLTDAAQMVETEEYTETEEITVSLSDESPSSGTFITGTTIGQGIAHIASYDFANSTNSDAVVTSLSLERTGVSSDTTLSTIYLFDGWTRITDSATVSSGVITWNDTGGLFTIPAGSTVTVAVRTDIASGTSGQTLGVSLDPDDVVYDGFESSGSALESEEHTIASVTNFGTVSFATTTTPSSDGTPEPQDDFRVWENTVTIGNNEAWLYVLRYRNIGSINASDLGNWMLYVAGVNYGDTVEEQDADGYVSFDLSSDPVKMNTGNHVIKVLADIWGGSTRTVTLGLRNTADAVFLDDDYDQPILVQANSLSFSARDATAQTIASGDITFTKETGSASGDVINNASNVTLASFEARATGEAMKVENLSFNIVEDDDHAAFTLRNGGIFVDDVQVGSTTAICGSDTTSGCSGNATSGDGVAYTTFTFGSSFIVYPGSPVTMEVRADIYDSSGTNDVVATDTLQAVIDATGASSNVLRMTSGSYISRPTSDVTGNTLTVEEGSLTVAKNTSVADQTVVVPKTAYLVGSWTISADTTEDINLTSFDVDFDTDDDSGAAIATDDYTNLYIEYGPADDMTTSSTKGSVTAANSWSLDYTIASGETIYVNAYADVLSGASVGTDGDDWIMAELDVVGTAPSSGASVSSSDIEAQTMTYYNSGTFTTALAGDTPVARAVAGSQTVEAAKFKFTAQNEDYTITEMRFAVSSSTEAGVISLVEIYDSSGDLQGSGVFSAVDGDHTGDGEGSGSANTASSITGLSIAIANNTSETLTIKYVLNDIGTGAGASQNNVDLQLDAVRYSDSQGTQATDGNDRAGNEVRVYKTIPTVTHTDLTNSTIVNGQAIDLYKFTITADSAGPVSLKQLAFPISFTDVEADTLVVDTWKLYKNGTDISTSSTTVAIEDQAGTDLEGSADNLVEGDVTVYVIWDTGEEVISAGESVTYTLRGTPQGFDSDGDTGEEDYFTIYLAGDTAAHNSDGGTVGLTDACLDDTGTGNIWELGDTAGIGTDCSATDTLSTAYNFIWSDANLAGHDGSETTAPDWANGYLILSLDLDGETWFK